MGHDYWPGSTVSYTVLPCPLTLRSVYKEGQPELPTCWKACVMSHISPLTLSLYTNNSFHLEAPECACLVFFPPLHSLSMLELQGLSITLLSTEHHTDRYRVKECTRPRFKLCSCDADFMPVLEPRWTDSWPLTVSTCLET